MHVAVLIVAFTLSVFIPAAKRNLRLVVLATLVRALSILVVRASLRHMLSLFFLRDLQNLTFMRVSLLVLSTLSSKIAHML